MAHFCNDRYERISGQTIPLRIGGRRTVLVWGGIVNGRPLSVLASQQGVLRIEEQPAARGTNPQYRTFIVRAVRDVDTVNLIISPSNNAADAWDTVTFLVNNAEEQNAYNRNRLITLARSFYGCHYLEGAAGAMPDQLNGMPSKPGGVKILTPERVRSTYHYNNGDIYTSAAYTDIKGFHSCAGKPWWPNRHDSPPFAANADSLNMSLENGTHSYRTVYMNRNRTRDSPPIIRRLGIILGERCEGKRHFDCVGFISYCLSMTLETSYIYDISGIADYEYRSYANNFPIVGRDTQPADLPGDILIFGGTERDYTDSRGVQKRIIVGAHHIAFSLGDGRQMIHAADTQWGVTISSIGRDLTRRIRHPRLG